jgi:hypothetical protein
MKIVLLVVGPLFIAIGLFWFGQGWDYSQARSMLH